MKQISIFVAALLISVLLSGASVVWADGDGPGGGGGPKPIDPPPNKIIENSYILLS